jgi:hypothetical protein
MVTNLNKVMPQSHKITGLIPTTRLRIACNPWRKVGRAGAVDGRSESVFIDGSIRYNVARIRVNPMHAARSVCPTPHTSGYHGAIWRLEDS